MEGDATLPEDQGCTRNRAGHFSYNVDTGTETLKPAPMLHLSGRAIDLGNSVRNKENLTKQE